MEVQFCINNIFEIIGTPVTYENMCGYFKSNYYGKIFVKKINEDLVLLCNNFDSKSDSSELYNECRSLVVQTGMDPKVISYTHDNIEYLKISQHQPNQDDIYEESFEGTLVSIFCYKGTWHFTTSRCASIDQSYYYDKTKTFGRLFDDCLMGIGFNFFIIQIYLILLVYLLTSPFCPGAIINGKFLSFYYFKSFSNNTCSNS